MMRQCNLNKRQQGVVLFLALIALVVMSLAAASLVRNVDTNTTITGNLAFKQSAVTAADAGIEAAFNWLNTAAAANLAGLNANRPGDGYFAVIPDLHQAPPYAEVNLDDPTELRADATWANGVTIGGLGDGNTVTYIVQRMCLQQLDPEDATNSCLFGDAPNGGEDLTGGDQYKKGQNFDVVASPMYRVTVRVQGPKNTESYVQAYAY